MVLLWLTRLESPPSFSRGQNCSLDSRRLFAVKISCDPIGVSGIQDWARMSCTVNKAKSHRFFLTWRIFSPGSSLCAIREYQLHSKCSVILDHAFVFWALKRIIIQSTVRDPLWCFAEQSGLYFVAWHSHRAMCAFSAGQGLPEPTLEN